MGRQQRVGHFKAVVIHRKIVTVRDRLGTQTYRLWGDIPGVVHHKWFRLVNLYDTEANHPQKRRRRGTFQEIKETNRLDALLTRCLLYTSDAADE